MRFCPRCHSIYGAEVPHCAIDGASLEVARDDPIVGREIANYVVRARVGLGATGAVYHVERAGTDDGFAMKILFGDLAANEHVVSRFLGSAELSSKIDHESVVVPIEYGQTDEGLCYLVMPFVAGRTLRTILDGERSMPPARVANILRQVASGLHAAHQGGCVHRDIKPTNILVSRERDREVARLVDFGLAALLSELPHHPELVGTPIYMAPEIARAPKTVSGSADLYALGVLTYEMLAGFPPFDGRSVVDLVMRHSLDAPPALPDADGLELITHWLLEKNPADRPSAANTVVEEIDRLGLEPYVLPEGPGDDDTLGPRPAIDMVTYDEEEIVTEDLLPHGGALIPIVTPLGDSDESGAILGYEFLRGRFDLVAESVETNRELDARGRATWSQRLDTLRGELQPGETARTYVELAARLAEFTTALNAAHAKD